MPTDARRGDAAGRGPHHIASVAHHFLGEADAARPGAGPRAVAVAAAESLPVTAFVAAGAARTGAVAAGAPWGLLEEEGTPWSTREHLGDDARVHLLGAAAFARQAPAAGGLCWHLGPVGGDRLDAWAAACGLPGCGLPTGGLAPHLFWCVAAEAATALAPLTALARLAGLLEPARVDVIVAPRGWPRRGTGGAATAVGDGVLARLRHRVTEVCGRPVRLGVVAPGMGTAAAAALVTGLLHADAPDAGA